MSPAALTRECAWCNEPFELPHEASRRKKCPSCAPRAANGKVLTPKKLLRHDVIVRSPKSGPCSP